MSSRLVTVSCGSPVVAMPRRYVRRKPRRTYRRRRPTGTRRVRVSRPNRFFRGTTSLVLNRMPRDRPLKAVRTIHNAYVFNATNVGTGGSGATLVFDPVAVGSASTYGLLTWAGTGSAGFAPVADWASYANLYDQFRVEKIVLTFTCVDNVGSGIGPVILYARYNYDRAVTPTAATFVRELPNVHQFGFTYEHNVCQYTIYPRIERAIGATSITSSVVGLAPSKMPYVDVDTPVPILGGIIGFDGTWAGTQFEMAMSITYHLKFKYRAGR